MLQAPPTKYQQAKAIIRQVAWCSNMKPEDLTGKRRFHNVTHARHFAMYQIRVATKMSYPDIGLLFNRDHSTVIAACKKFSEWPEVVK